jgi:hypothetical protein
VDRDASVMCELVLRGVRGADVVLCGQFVIGANRMFKAVQLRNMFLYCNTRGPDAKPVKDLSELAFAFKTLGMNNVQYLLQPVSGSMRLTVNKELNPPPRVKVDAQIDALRMRSPSPTPSLSATSCSLHFTVGSQPLRHSIGRRPVPALTSAHLSPHHIS